MVQSSSSNERYFQVGETIHLRVRVSAPGTRVPVDPAVVTLTRLVGPTPVVQEMPTFARVEQGDYEAVLRSADLEPGAYTLVITVSDGPDKVSVLTDRFVLRAA